MEEDSYPPDDWDYNVCNDSDLKYLDEDYLISSDEAVSNNATTYQKFNQLHPTTKRIYKLIQSTKPKTNIWKTIEISRPADTNSQNLDVDQEIHVHKDASPRQPLFPLENWSDDTDEDPNYIPTAEEEISSSESEKAQGLKLYRSKIKDSQIMESSRKKRKHSSSSEEESYKPKKKSKMSKDEGLKEFVGNKKEAHSVSSSDSECGSKSSSGIYEENLNKKFDHLLTSDEERRNSVKTTVTKTNHSLNSPNKSVKNALDKNKSQHLLSSTENLSESVASFTSSKLMQENPEINGLSDSGTSSLENSQISDHYMTNNRSSGVRQKSGINIRSQEKTNRKKPFREEDLKELSKYSFLLDEKLAEENNVWILQCPNSLDCAELVGQSLDLTGKGSSSLNVGNTVFESYSYIDNSSRSATLAVPSCSDKFQLCKIPIIGNIIIEESVHIENKKSFSIPRPPQSVELPQNLRTRHPLLGLDYERKVLISSITPHKSKKKKKHSRSPNRTSSGKLNGESESFSEEIVLKKDKHKKKKKDS